MHYPTRRQCLAALAASAALPTLAASDQPLTEGEVVRWDPHTQKITLRHGEIKNLGMPPMTMVFRVPDPPALPLAPGSKVRFRAEQQQGAFVVTHIEAAP
ncbi:MAG: copper-binding protein [Acidovorax sp.]|uniref:copper-binding protein n=1 Tax=Acidovorax sp. TaxID=1872122 RepID=UPI0039E7151C